MECETLSFVSYASFMTRGLCVCVFDKHVTLLANGIILHQNKRHELRGMEITQHNRHLEAKRDMILNSNRS